jgi:hypothetical protein
MKLRRNGQEGHESHMGWVTNATEFYSEGLKEIAHLGDLDVDGRECLKKYSVMVRTRFI